MQLPVGRSNSISQLKSSSMSGQNNRPPKVARQLTHDDSLTSHDNTALSRVAAQVWDDEATRLVGEHDDDDDDALGLHLGQTCMLATAY
jgi:hypothetical protein